MIIFKKLTMRNFLSFGNVPTTIPLNQRGITLILGEDLDHTVSGVGANGTGKSTIINALVYALYDKPISSISKDNLVNNINKKHMEVSVEFEKNGKQYKIVRARKMKIGQAGNYVILYENGKDISTGGRNNANVQIEKILNIPYDLFVRIAAFSASHIPFLDLPVRSHYQANQTDIIEELFDLKTLSEKAELLKKEIKTTEQSLETQLERVKHHKETQQRHENQLKSAKRRIVDWDTKNKTDIKRIQDKLKQLEGVDVDHQRMLYNQLTEINQQLTERTNVQRITKQTIKDANSEKTKQEKELKHLKKAKCPYCLQEYKDSKSKIIELEQQLKLLDDTLDEQLIQFNELNNDIEQIKKQKKHIDDQITVNDLNNLLEVWDKLNQYHNKLKELEQDENPYLEPYEELESTKLEPIKKGAIDTLTTKLEHQRFLLKLLTKKDSFVRKTLLNKNIPFLNQRLSHYLRELGLPHNVEFTHEMTVKISLMGRVLDFGNLSNGQRARVNIALSFAFRDVVQSMHEYINICMLDEVLDVGLDALGVQSAAIMLKHKARDDKTSIYVISHKTEEIENAFDQKLIVQISKGVSTVIEE